MRILYLSHYFPPEMGAPSARVFELSKEWVKLGHSVTVVTGFPNHPTGVIPQEYRGQWLQREQVEGIQVLRVPIYAAANRQRVLRGLNYLSFAASASLLGPLLVERPDVLIATSPQLLTGVAGRWLSGVLRVPFVFEVRDLWPQSIVAVGALSEGHPVIRALEQLELSLYRAADRIVVVTDAFVESLVQRGVPREKLAVVKNGVDLDLFQPRPPDEALRRELGLGAQDFMCLYVGTHGMAHGLMTILEAAELVREDPRIRFVLVGEGADKSALKRHASERNLANVTFVDRQPHERIPAYVAASDASLVLLKDRPLFRTVLPSKIFEILGAARPLILGVEGEARALVEASGGGLCVPPEDAGALAGAIRTLQGDPTRRAAMGQAGRRFVETGFSRAALAGHYLDILSRLTQRS